jgi:hypothetical protein
MMRQELERMKEWAAAKIQGGSEPPWAWYQYMKLIETIDAILQGMDSVVLMEDSRRSQGQPERHLRLVDDNDQQETSPRRSAGLPVQMPM